MTDIGKSAEVHSVNFYNRRLSQKDFDEYKLDNPDAPNDPVTADDDPQFCYDVIVRGYGQDVANVIKATARTDQDFLRIECVDGDTVVRVVISFAPSLRLSYLLSATRQRSRGTPPQDSSQALGK